MSDREEKLGNITLADAMFSFDLFLSISEKNRNMRYAKNETLRNLINLITKLTFIHLTEKINVLT